MNQRRRFGRKRAVVAGVVLALGAGGGLWAYYAAGSAPKIPTATVKRGAFVDWVKLQGEVKASDSKIITAPYRAGNLRILKLVSTGTKVKRGDVVVEFDATQMRQTIAQDRVALKSARAQVEQARAQASLKEQKDLTAVQKAGYNVESARLDASQSEIVSQIQGAESELKLTDAKENLSSAQTKLAADRASDEATVGGKREALAEAEYQLREDERAAGELTLRAPMDGVVTLLNTNWNAGGPFGMPQPFKPGDRVWAGAPIAELPNLSTLEVSARVDETERGQLAEGQHAVVRFSAIPDRTFTGRIAAISRLASVDFSGGWPFPRNFEVRLALDQKDPRLLPNMQGTVRIEAGKVANAIVVPAQALFSVNGERVAYVREGSGFVARRIVVAQESGGQAMVAKGLEPGEIVALEKPKGAS